MTTLLNVKNLNAHYGVIQVLWNICLQVEEQEIVSLLGPNGAGKSTLLKTTIGLNRSTSGMIEFEGKRIEKTPANKIVDQGICYIPEGRRIFPEMTVLENLEMGALPARARPKMKDNIKQVYDLFPTLEERSSQMAGTLSGGERQMLAIARGLMSNPKLMMIDEPSLGLAPKIVQQIFSIVKDINTRGVTVLLVEQNVKQTLKLSDRTYILESGKIILQGKSQDLIDNDYVRKAYLAA